MTKMTAVFPKVTIDKQGIAMSATWFQKSRSIPWEQVLAIATTGRDLTKVCYASKNGRICRIILRDRRRYQDMAVQQWKQALFTNIVATQELTGSFVYFSSRWERYYLIVFLLAGIGFFGYGLLTVLSTSWKWFQYGASEFHQLMKWVTYYGLVSMSIPLMSCVISLGMVIFLTTRLTHWRAWKISPAGLFRQRDAQQWEPVSMRADDQVCPSGAIIGGERIPLWQPFFGGLTNNAILPHLLAILAKRRHIVPTIGTRHFPLGVILRFTIFWPSAILGLWYAPLLVWEVPSELDLTIQLTASVVLGACGVASIGFGIEHLLKRPRYRERFTRFLAEIEQIQQRLQWE